MTVMKVSAFNPQLVQDEELLSNWTPPKGTKRSLSPDVTPAPPAAPIGRARVRVNLVDALQALLSHLSSKDLK